MVKPLTNPFASRPAPLGNLLAACAHHLSDALNDGLENAGFSDLRASHAPVFLAVDPGGTRLTDLAQRAHMSKQAMGELVRHLSDRGYLEVMTDKQDARARLVRPTTRGWDAVSAAMHVVDSFDAWLDASIGTSQVAQLRGTLELVLQTDPQEWPQVEPASVPKI